MNGELLVRVFSYFWAFNTTMKIQIYIFGVLLAFIGFSSCSTDFDVVGDYEETTIVYGMLDQSETVHFIKVNKSFLGPGNAYDYATVRDSSEYVNVDGIVEEWINGVKTRQWTVQDTVLTDREDGIFYGPEQTVYYFIEPALDEDAEYRLILDIEEGYREVTGATTMVGDVSFHQQTSLPTVIGFYNSAASTYTDLAVKWYSSTNGKRYDINFRFKWDEITATDTTRKYLDWFIGSEEIADADLNNPGQVLEKQATGLSFFQFIDNKIPSDPNVIKRVFRGINIMASVASEDLYTYMIVNAPSNGLIQEKPQYTNLTNGVGIFSSKYNKALSNKFLNISTLTELASGPITGHLLFCSDSIAYNAYSFYCP